MRETIFVWDAVNDCVMSELDGSGAVQVTYTNEPRQYGGVISQRRGTTTSTYHADALGTTRALTDNSGNVTDTYLNDAWGNSVAATGTTVNPFRWVGKYGYYTDDSTEQVYVRARMYQPTTARWASVDPGFKIPSAWGFNYSACRPVQIIDPNGLEWRKVSSSIYEADSAGFSQNTLESLATQITGNPRDWVCIWPIEDGELWAQYPGALPCARADVSNLLEDDWPAFYQIAPKAIREPFFLVSLRKLFARAVTWKDGQDAAGEFRKVSKQGASPIGRLGILGDCYADDAICGDGGISPYTADDVFLVADEKDNSSNRYVHAVKKIGPPRCWLTRNALVYGVACNTSLAWGPGWSGRIARVGTVVYGTPSLLYGETSLIGRTFIEFVGLPGRYFTAKELLNSPHWSRFDGSQ